jgi:1-acyl-sn-glycerol-3-phosphate acyltransferase
LNPRGEIRYTVFLHPESESMAKRVLGNDPFLRGAAVRAPAPTPAPVPPPPAPARVLSAVVSSNVTSDIEAPPADRRRPSPIAEAPPEPPPQPSPSAASPFSTSRFLDRARATLEAGLASPTWQATRQAVLGLAHAVSTGLGRRVNPQPDAYGRDGELVAELEGVIDFLYRTYWRVQVEGAEHLPKGPALVVANHAGAIPLDGPILSWAIARERPDLAGARWLVEDQVFFAPFIGPLLNRLGGVRASPDHALSLLAERRPVLVFPEGIHGISKPYSDRYRLQRFGRGGFVKVALRAGVPIIPTAVIGSEETLPLLGKLPVRPGGVPYLPITPLGLLPLPVRWTLRFGAPLDLGAHQASDAGNPAAVAELTEATRQRIAQMLPKK